MKKIHLNSNKEYPNKIHTLQELISALSKEDQSEYDSIIRSTDFSSNEFDEYCSWSNKCYTRNCITENDKFELILLCWNECQGTPIHDHGGEECWVKFIKGEFRETIYNKDENGKLKFVKSVISNPNDISYMIDFIGFHSLENLSNQKGMSLHLYAKPIRNCNVFDNDLKKFVNKEMSYSTIPTMEAN